MFTLNYKGKLLLAEKPLVMGIINATPDSFYKGYLNEGSDQLLAIVSGMMEAGADILDVGGQSTRPGSQRISAKEEMERVIPVLRLIKKHHSEVIISIDTYHSAVASAAVAEGASIVNDISAGEMDKDMLTTVAALQVPYICMHMKGTPETMHQDIFYEDVVKEVLDFFIKKMDECQQAGIHDVIIDPGFGFGKTITHNLQLLKNLSLFKMLKRPILAGLSRKSSVYKTLKVTPEEALNGTTVLNTLALENGTDILRVHDVKEAREAISLVSLYKKSAQ